MITNARKNHLSRISFQRATSGQTLTAKPDVYGRFVLYTDQWSGQYRITKGHAVLTQQRFGLPPTDVAFGWNDRGLLKDLAE